MPVPDNGAPIGGVVPLYGKKVVPLKAASAVTILPDEPLSATLKVGKPIAAPV